MNELMCAPSTLQYLTSTGDVVYITTLLSGVLMTQYCIQKLLDSCILEWGVGGGSRHLTILDCLRVKSLETFKGGGGEGGLRASYLPWDIFSSVPTDFNIKSLELNCWFKQYRAYYF